MTERDVTSGDVRLRVRDYGGDGPPIVLLHGLSSNTPIWDHVAPLLTGTLHVVAYDQRNHGLSGDAGDFSFPAVAGDVDALGLDRPIVVGHSWGASVALHYAATHPDCPGAVGVDGGVSFMRARGTTWEDAYKRLLPPHMEGTEDELFGRIRTFPSPIAWERSEPVMRRAFVAGPDGVYRRRLPIDKHMKIAHELWAQDMDAVYGAIRCPVMLVLAGGLEGGDAEAGFVAMKRDSAARLTETYPEVRVEWLPSVHDMPLLHPDELAALVAGFARQVTRR